MFRSVFRAFGLARGSANAQEASSFDISPSEIISQDIKRQKDNRARSSKTEGRAATSSESVPVRPPRPKKPSTTQRYTKESVPQAKVISADRMTSDYDLIKVVGESKVAVVTLATDLLNSGRKVAIKRHPRRNGDSHVYREATIQSQVDHPNIAKLHAFSENEGYLYLIQEFCPGGELFDAVVPDVGCSPYIARSYTLQLLKALAYLHSLNIAHRDIKPENIMLSSDKQQIKVIDFGLSELCVPGMKYKQHIGTVPYMAVELWAPTTQGYAEMDLKAIDVWAAGVVLYCMMSGRFPWSEATSRSPEWRRYKAADFSHAPWPELADKQPVVLELLLNMLNMDPAERWTAQQCIDFIEAKWIVEPPRRKIMRRPANLRLSALGKNSVKEDAPALSPLALSPYPEAHSEDDHHAFRFSEMVDESMLEVRTAPVQTIRAA